jgi:hypothetical protein
MCPAMERRIISPKSPTRTFAILSKKSSFLRIGSERTRRRLFLLVYPYIFYQLISFRKSTRPSIVSVEALNTNGGCSDKALITARSRHSTEQSAVILATDAGF